MTPRELIQRFRRRMAQPVELLRLAWSTGALEDLLEQLRYRRQLTRVHRSLYDFRYATALLLAHRSGLLEALDERALSFSQAAEQTGIQPRAAEALMRILESQQVLQRRDGRFQMSPFGRMALSLKSPHSIRNLLDLLAAQAASFPEIAVGMSTGCIPAGLNVLNQSSNYGAFLDAVNGYLLLATIDLLSRIELPPIRRLIMGSMGVSFSSVVLKRFPDARVTYGCLEHLVREIPRLCERYGVRADQIVEMHDHAGDPEADAWGSEPFDLVLLTKKMILAPEERLGERFARKAFTELRPGGVGIFWECVHTNRCPTPVSRAMEAVMDLGASPNGLINTEDSIRQLLGSIGFERIEIVACLGGATTFVVAYKPTIC